MNPLMSACAPLSLLLLLFVWCESQANEWTELTPLTESPPARIRFAGELVDFTSQCFIITHGMGGTRPDDRFHDLAAAINRQLPDACVVLVDWSEASCARFGAIPNPWKVSGRINDVGDYTALMLESHGFNPANSVFIGESFGNWVNARIAQKLGIASGIIAMNPARAIRGCHPPDLRELAGRSWSFHTDSIFDTTQQIAESDFLLETSPKATQWERHTAGVKWLASRVSAGNVSWLRMDKELPEGRTGYFSAAIVSDGSIANIQPPRIRKSQVAIPELTDLVAAPPLPNQPIEQAPPHIPAQP